MTRSRHSAGILAYRRVADVLEVFLVHPGGPFWAGRDAGAWGIPKGEYSADEPAMQAARREFHEETGLTLSGELEPLTPVRQPGGKRISAWAVHAPQLDPTQLRSNDFSMEWPPNSGRQQRFPEVDRGAWFPLEQAHARIHAGQRALLEELAQRLVARAAAGHVLASSVDSQ